VDGKEHSNYGCPYTTKDSAPTGISAGFVLPLWSHKVGDVLLAMIDDDPVAKTLAVVVAAFDLMSEISTGCAGSFWPPQAKARARFAARLPSISCQAATGFRKIELNVADMI
jgi:hypothetical protein